MAGDSEHSANCQCPACNWNRNHPEESSEAMVTITQKEYDELLDRQAKLNALENGGVDNWDGYDWAMENYRAETE